MTALASVPRALSRPVRAVGSSLLWRLAIWSAVVSGASWPLSSSALSPTGVGSALLRGAGRPQLVAGGLPSAAAIAPAVTADPVGTVSLVSPTAGRVVGEAAHASSFAASLLTWSLPLTVAAFVLAVALSTSPARLLRRAARGAMVAAVSVVVLTVWLPMWLVRRPSPLLVFVGELLSVEARRGAQVAAALTALAVVALLVSDLLSRSSRRFRTAARQVL